LHELVGELISYVRVASRIRPRLLALQQLGTSLEGMVSGVGLPLARRYPPQFPSGAPKSTTPDCCSAAQRAYHRCSQQYDSEEVAGQ
jgi:hypothetical protein